MYRSGERGRPNVPDRDRHCAKPGRGDLPAPHPPWLMQPTRVGGIGPLPRGGSPEFTVRQSVAISTGLRLCQSVRPPRHRSNRAPPKARSCNVCAPDAAAAPAPPLRRGRRVLAARMRHRRADASSPRAAVDVIAARRRRPSRALGLGPAPRRFGTAGPTWRRERR